MCPRHWAVIVPVDVSHRRVMPSSPAGGDARAVRAESKGPGETDVLGGSRLVLPESESCTVKSQHSWATARHCQPRTVRADGHQIGLSFRRPLQWRLDTPLVVQELQDVRGHRLADCADAGSRARLSPVPADEPAVRARRQRGMSSTERLGPLRTRAQEFVTFQVGEAKPALRQRAIRMPAGSRIRN